MHVHGRWSAVLRHEAGDGGHVSVLCQELDCRFRGCPVSGRITAPGEAAAGLPAAFVLRRSDIPADPDRQPRPRSLPDAVLKLIAGNLDLLEERCGISERRITEI